MEKITRQTPIILYDIPAEKYITGTLEKMNADQMPVCTQRHMIDQMCKLFERVTPNMKENPMYQDKIDWHAIENDYKPERRKTG